LESPQPTWTAIFAAKGMVAIRELIHSGANTPLLRANVTSPAVTIKNDYWSPSKGEWMDLNFPELCPHFIEQVENTALALMNHMSTGLVEKKEITDSVRKALDKFVHYELFSCQKDLTKELAEAMQRLYKNDTPITVTDFDSLVRLLGTLSPHGSTKRVEIDLGTVSVIFEAPELKLEIVFQNAFLGHKWVGLRVNGKDVRSVSTRHEGACEITALLEEAAGMMANYAPS